jgi:hypothetical protein
MSTLKSINVIHPSGTTNNIVNDASGNVTFGGTITAAVHTSPAAPSTYNHFAKSFFVNTIYNTLYIGYVVYITLAYVRIQ